VKKITSEKKKYFIALATNVKALLDERGVGAVLMSMNWSGVAFVVDATITEEFIMEIYCRLDVASVHYDVEKKILSVGIEMPPVLWQMA
jgi:hypothetical protein